jgi:pimeloyl-ACP methyl ester carboxylesterase
MKYFAQLLLLLVLSIYVNAAEIKQTTFAYWNKPDVEIFYITPEKINKDTKVIFVIHGNSRNAEDYLSAWIPHVINKNVIVAAPQFRKIDFRYFFLLEMAESSGKVNSNKNEYINNSISLFFNYLKSKFSLSTETYRMFGHSAGAQFTHRYMLLSMDNRISNTVIANAGWYTFITDDEFPYGIKNSPINISNEQIKWFMSKKANLLIGSDDIGFKSVNSSKGAKLQGLTRVDRATNYFDSLIMNAESRGYALRWNYRVLDRVDHDFKKVTPYAAKILLRDIKNIN